MDQSQRKESRVAHFEGTLADLEMRMAKKAFDFVKAEMCAAKGFVRHNGANYYTHLIDVAQKLLNAGVRDENVIAAALLHDAIEDIPGVTRKFIEEQYNAEVALIVDLVSKKPGVNYKIAENMEAYLAAIEEHVGASLVKTADRMHNFGTLKDATPEKKLKQADETETFFIPFFKRCRNRYPWYGKFFFEAKTAIEPHLWEIRERHEEVTALKAQILELRSEIQRLREAK